LLSADGNRLAISSPYSDNYAWDSGVLYGGMLSGYVRVYAWSGIDWHQLGGDIVGEAPWDRSGRSVSLSADGNRLAIGTEYNADNGTESGHVRVYEYSSLSGAWLQLGEDIDGHSAYEWSGYSVSLSADGSQLAIGAVHNDDNGPDSGQVRVYTWSDSDWHQLGGGISGEAASDWSGYSVSLSADGNRLAIGAPANDANGESSGQARIYAWSGIAWIQIDEDIDGEAAIDNSGRSISLSADGGRVAIGARENDGNGFNSGHVRVYELSLEVKLQELYVGILGRAADRRGLDYWLDQIYAGIFTLENTRAAFTHPDQAEYTEIYGGLTNSQLVTAIYENFLERAPDMLGFLYWVAELDNGRVNADQMINAIINAVQDPGATGEQSAKDLACLENKIEVAIYFTEKTKDYFFDVVYREMARAVVADVTEDPETLTQAKAMIDEYVGN
jgi:hypothetical protein